MTNNVVLVSDVQQSDSVIHIHVSILFQVLFPFRLLRSIEHSSLCYTVGPNEDTSIATGQFVTCQVIGKHMAKKKKKSTCLHPSSYKDKLK